MVCVCQIFRSVSIHTVFLLLVHAKRSLPWIQWPRSCLSKWYLQSNTSWIDLSTRFIQTLSAAYWWVLQHPLSKDWNLTLRQVPGPKPKAQQKAKLQVVYLKVIGILKSFVKHQRGPSWKWILAVKMLPPRLFDLLGSLGIAMNSYEISRPEKTLRPPGLRQWPLGVTARLVSWRHRPRHQHCTPRNWPKAWKPRVYRGF